MTANLWDLAQECLTLGTLAALVVWLLAVGCAS